MKLTIDTIDYHRNGIAGEGFHVVTFIKESDESPTTNMVAVLFFDYDEETENEYVQVGRCAVFDRDLIGKNEIRFFHNSWRGDRFEHLLTQAIREWSERYDYSVPGYPDPQGWVFSDDD